MKLYIITGIGSPFDLRVGRVFATKELAEDWMKGHQPEVTEFCVTDILFIQSIMDDYIPKCKKCNDRGRLYDKEGNRTGTCPCHY